MKRLSDITRFKEHETIVLKGFDPVSSAGFTMIPNFILNRKDLTVGARIAYAVLLSYAWHNDCVFPGQERMAKETGMGRRSVIRYIKELQEKGFLEIDRRGQGKTNVYVLSYKVQKNSRS